MTPAQAILTPLRRIPGPKGDVLHAMKACDCGFAGFGEVYFSQVVFGAVKGWKRHREMVLNLVCVVGAVRFVVLEDHEAPNVLIDTVLSPERVERYQRLTVPPMLWVGFEGIGTGLNLVMNVASVPHDPAEADTVALQTFPWPEERALVASVGT